MTESRLPLPINNEQLALADWQSAGTNATLKLSGHFNAHTLSGLWSQTKKKQQAWLASAGPASQLTIDLAQVNYLDGAGIAFLIDLKHTQAAAGGTVTLENLDPRYEPLIQQYQPIETLFPVHDGNHHAHISLVERIGKGVYELAEDAKHQTVFIGQIASSIGWAIRYPRQVRWNDFINVGVEAGVAALPIVSLVAFLIGVILAFQSAIGLKQFGAETFVANLVSLSIFRELGPLMTAILLAGRSSAAFAAEIGTMTVNKVRQREAPSAAEASRRLGSSRDITLISGSSIRGISIWVREMSIAFMSVPFGFIVPVSLTVTLS